MIKVINLSKSFGAETILDSISFNINEGERVGLAGRNGHGKTTLLRILTGEEHPDEGEVQIPRGYTLGYASQHLNFTSETVLAEGCRGLPEHMKDEVWKVEKILSGLGFSSDDMKRHPSEFSGGYQVRLNLARLLVSEPDLLLLDEPTNYLDVVSIRWLSGFLRQWKGELILVTHDRSFMDSVTTHTMGIHRKKLRKITGPTDKLYEQILKEEEIYEKTRINDEKKRKETEQYINRFRAKARLAGMVQSRIKALEKQEKLDKLESMKNLDFSFAYSPYPGKTAMEVKELTFGYNADDPLIKNFSMTVRHNDRICVIGKNGKGKTTLLKLMTGELKPVSGEITAHPATSVGYYAQTNTIKLNESLTIEEELMNCGCEKQEARNICGAMMFEGDLALKKIKVLSGGEKSRVLLGKVLASPCNLLFLDEPTNHLDMESCDAFVEAVDAFPGAAVIVTHNEFYLHTLANRFVIFQSDGVSVFEGTYQSFLDKTGWEDEEAAAAESPAETDNDSRMVNKKDVRKKRAEIQTRKNKELGPLGKQIEKTETEIDSLEKELARFNEEMIAASQNGEGEKIAVLSKKIHANQTRIDELFDELDRITTEFEEKSEVFEQELALLQ